MSAQRVNYSISRDGVLPFSAYFSRLSKRKMAVNAANLVTGISIVLTTAVIGSTVVFSANTFVPAKWNLGKLSLPLSIISSLYICFLFVVLILPQSYPVTSETLSYTPICIGIISILSVVGWIFLKLDGQHWFKGLIKTIMEEELTKIRIEGGVATVEDGDALRNLSYGHRKSSVGIERGLGE